MTTYTRPVLLLLCGLLLLTLAIAVLNTLVPLWLAHDNLPTWQVGMVSSAYFSGNLLGTLLAGVLIKRYGFNRSYYLASALFAIGCVGLGITLGFWSWLGWRFLAGIGCAMIWVVVESALMCSGNARNRGRLLAAYMMVYYLGTVLGQLLVSKLPTGLMEVLPWATGLVLAAILPLLFTRIVSERNEQQGSTRLCADQLLRLRAPQPFSLFFSGGTLLDAAPWLQALGEVALPERNLAGLGKILWGEGELLRVITTDSVGAFAELVLPAGTLLVWAPAPAQQALQQVIAALPPQVQWSHLTSLDPSGVDRVLTLAQRLGRPASWWLPTSLAPIMAAYALPLTDSRPWEPSRIPKSLLAVCSGLVESNGGLSAEVCALAPQWHAIG